MTKRQRRQPRFNEWAEVLTDVEALETHGYDHACRGNLSLGQICNHLAVVMEGALDGFPKAMPWPVRKLLRLLFLKSMLQHKPSGIRFPAPPFARQSAPVKDKVGIERLKAAAKRFDDPNATYVMHLAFGNLTKEQQFPLVGTIVPARAPVFSVVPSQTDFCSTTGPQRKDR